MANEADSLLTRAFNALPSRQMHKRVARAIKRLGLGRPFKSVELPFGAVG
jgi:hypothetical protein